MKRPGKSKPIIRDADDASSDEEISDMGNELLKKMGVDKEGQARKAREAKKEKEALRRVSADS